MLSLINQLERVSMKKIILVLVLSLTSLAHAKFVKNRKPAQAAPQKLECLVDASGTTGLQNIAKKSDNFKLKSAAGDPAPQYKAKVVMDITSPYGHKFTVDVDASSIQLPGMTNYIPHIFASLFVNDVQIQYTNETRSATDMNLFYLKDPTTKKDIMYSFACQIVN